MLSDLTKEQESDESVWQVRLTFDISTRHEEDGELIERHYNFGYSEAFDSWSLVEFEEHITPDTESMMERKWEKKRHLTWEDPEQATIDVPPEVTQKLDDAINADVMTLDR